MTFFTRPPQRPVLPFSITVGNSFQEWFSADYTNVAGVGTSVPSPLRFGAYRIVDIAHDGNTLFKVVLVTDPPTTTGDHLGSVFEKLVLTGTFSGGAATLTVYFANKTQDFFITSGAGNRARVISIPAASTFGIVMGNTYTGVLS